MKQNFVRLSTRAKTVSLRTLALVMGLVMLLSAVGVGSTLSAFALTNDSAGSGDQAASLSAVADLGTGIADTATQLKPTLPAYANASLRGDKEDLADTGANVELAETGYSTATFYLQDANGTAVTNSGDVTLSSNKGTWTWTGANSYQGQFLRFYIKAGNDQFGINGSTTSSNYISGATSSNWNLGKGDYVGYYQVSSNALTVTFSFTLNSNDGTLSVSQTTGSTACSTDKYYIITGSQQLTNTSNWQNSWTGAGTRNQMTYDSSAKMYKVVYSNIPKNSSSSEHFRWRILDVGSATGTDSNWGTTRGYDQGSGAITDASNLLQYNAKGTDNTFEFSLKANANITIYYDDSKSNNKAIQVVITPAASTVTAGTSTGGTVKVNGGTSASNVTYGGTVTLTATANDHYTFSKWNTVSNISYANANAASTTATVSGDATVTATFVKTNYTVSKGTGTGFTITTPSSNQSKQWGTSVTVTAKADSAYALDYLYYLNNNTGSEVKIGSDATSSEITSGTMTRTLSSMPTNNITVYAKVHEKTSNTVTYGVCTGQSSYGYVNVGLYHNSASTIKYTIDSGSKVLEGDKVNFCARPAVGYKFVGWYNTSAATGGTLLSSSQDYTVTSPSGNYYARFSGDDLVPASNAIRLMVRATGSATNAASYVYAFDDNGEKTGTWRGTAFSSLGGTKSYGGNTYYYKDFANTSNLKIILNNSSGQTADITSMENGKTYILSYSGGTTKTDVYWGYTATGLATEAYYPVKYYVTNPDKGNMASTYTNAFAKKSTATNLYFKASDTTNWKTKITTTGFSSNDTDYETTSTSRSRTMYSSYREHKATVTFVEKKYYKVNFSAGAGGTVAATAGGKAITSGTPVMEGTSVTITATPSSGNAVSGWTASGSLSGSSTNTSRTFTISADTTAKVYFSASRGTVNTGTYFGWAKASTDTNVYPGDWTNFSTTYVRDGHVFAYIDNVTAGYYYISAYGSAVTSSSSAQDKCEKQYYRTAKDTAGAVWCSTEFSTYITNLGRSEWGSNDSPCWNGRCNYGHFQVSSAVKALIIDLGPDNGSGVAQTHLGDDNHKFVQNNYRIIPVFNTDVNKVSVYAKDGSYRGNSSYDYLTGIADTVITASTYVTGRTQHTEFETAVATKGQSIKVTTTVDSSHRSRYYVRGFSVNGVTPELYEYSSGGVYTMTYTIPADFDDDYLEITPIYAENGVTNVRFYIENYDEAFQNTGWGNTLAVYPFYENASGSYAQTKHNAFGGYPGQPVINNGGRRFIEIPTSYTTLTVDGTTEDCHVKGVTLSNDYFDIVHRDYCREVDDHLQTYDYDDFYKIYKETSDGKEVNGKPTAADQITFAFKYRTATNNFADSSNTVSYSTTGKTVHAPYSSFTAAQKDTKFKNGWEPLLDYHDRPIDLFGKQLSSANQTKEPLLVVSDDYAITYAGRYATTWTVYYKNGSSYTKIAEIAPSALIVATQARLGTSTYPAVTDATGYPSTTGHKLADYSDEYQALMAYADTPVQITYESAIRNNSSYEKYWSMTGGSSEVAKRSDGRWFYSYEGEIINADLRIDYTDEYKGEENTTWTTDTFKGNTGEVTGATVHFTNKSGDTDGPYALEDYHDTADYNGDIVSNFNHYYKFEATEGSGYIFQGWYMERDGISTAVNADDIKNLAGKSQMTSNATFVARYVKNPAGHITINHTMDDGSTGTGTTYIGVEAKSANGDWTWITGDGTDHFERADKVSVTDTNVMSYNSGYTLRVTLKTEVAADTAFDRFSADDDEHSPNYFSSDVTTSGTTSTTFFEVPVDDLFQIVEGFPKQQFDTLTYFSHTTKRPELTINHNIDPTSDSTAEGDTYVKVEVLSAGGTIVETYGGNETDGYAKGKDLVVPSTYYNGTDDYRIKVYLKTEMKGFTQFDHFSILGYVITNAAGPNGETITLSSSTDQRTKFATATFSAAACYNRGQHVLPYLSKLVVPDYKYQLKYTYPSYVKEYNNQSYTAKDSFAPEELTEYMTLNNGDLAFQDDGKKLSFICLKAPYEDNYQKTLDFSKNSTITGRGYKSTDYTMQLDISVTAENKQLSAYFDFPYATTPSNEFKPVVTDGKVVKTDPNRQGKTDIYGRDWFVTNDVRHEGITGTPEFVKAPLIIYDGNKPMYFKYWSVKTEATDTNKSVTYTRCYDYEFNLAIFQNCIITPEYDETDFAARGMAAPVPNNYGTNPQSSGYDRFDPDVNRDYYKTDDNGLTITFIENSRNQYNNGDAGNAPSERSGAADRLYSDFLLTYNYYDDDADVNYSKVILRDDFVGQKKAGMVIQPVAYMEKTEDGKGRIVQSDEYYANYSGSTKYQGATAEQIKSYIETGTVPSGMLGGQKLQDSRFDVSSLDNKNRIQYFFGMDNAVAKDSDAAADEDGILRVGADYNNKYLVYKAFAYIGDVSNGNTLTNVVVSSRPVYFTVYTDATIQPGYYMPNTSGN